MPFKHLGKYQRINKNILKLVIKLTLPFIFNTTLNFSVICIDADTPLRTERTTGPLGRLLISHLGTRIMSPPWEKESTENPTFQIVFSSESEIFLNLAKCSHFSRFL